MDGWKGCRNAEDLNVQPQKKQKRIYEIGKRAIDILLSLIGLIISLPLILILVIVIRLESEGSGVYCQTIRENG